MKSRIYIFLILLYFLLIVNAIAHVPITGGENNTLETAIEVKEPTKSWAIYDEILDAGESKYYKFSMDNGQRLKISLFVPEEGFTPGLVIMGEGLTSQGKIPSGVEVPSGYNYMVFEGESDKTRKYEQFTPTSYYFTADVDMTINTAGIYYVAVFDELNYGRVGIAIGYVETFSVNEWLLIPIDAINIHIWEGQNIAVILAPLYLTIIIGIGILVWRVKKEQKLKLNLHASLGLFAALLFIGSGLMIIMQMIMALAVSSADASLVITLIFALLPILFGFLIMINSFKIIKEINNKNRITMLLIGILGLIFWSGVIIGPVIIILISFLPIITTRKK